MRQYAEVNYINIVTDQFTISKLYCTLVQIFFAPIFFSSFLKYLFVRYGQGCQAPTIKTIFFGELRKIIVAGGMQQPGSG